MAGGTAPRNPLLVVILFALSGAISYRLMLAWDGGTYLGGITFALWAADLFVRPRKLWAVVIVLIDLVWIASERGAIFLIADHAWNPYLGMAVAGLLGGLGVAASTGIGCRVMLSARSLGASSVVGCLAALPFGWWEPRNSDEPYTSAAGLACFVVWQVAVGTTLWACSSRLPALPDIARDR